MAVLLFLVLMQFAWSFGAQQGGGAYSYSDSSGKRVSGTYELIDGHIVHTAGDPVAFSDTALPGSISRLRNWQIKHQNFKRRVFKSNLENQRLAYNAARKAFDLSSNQAGYYPNFATRFSQTPFQGFGGNRGRFNSFNSFPNFAMPHFPNSAFAGSAVGPGFRRQIAAINPSNPSSPNVNVNRISHYSDSPGRSGYRAVSSSSYATSSNVNGEEVNRRGAETIVDDNGIVTKYKVEN